MRAIHCPATSSMTTCPGSARLLSRSTIVAAGIPIATATSAAARVSHEIGPRARGSSFPAANQSSAAAAEPQDPGPGRSLPAPKNVATLHAQTVFFFRFGSVIGGGAPHTFHLFQQFGVQYRGGDAVSATRPFAEVDDAAMIAAERKIRIFRRHDLSARGAAQALGFAHGMLLTRESCPPGRNPGTQLSRIGRSGPEQADQTARSR